MKCKGWADEMACLTCEYSDCVADEYGNIKKTADLGTKTKELSLSQREEK